MSSKTVGINIDHSHKVWLAASKDDGRPVLAGVCVEPWGRGKVRLTASDGHILVSKGVTAVFEQDHEDEDFRVVVPLTAFKEMKKGTDLILHLDSGKSEWGDKNLSSSTIPFVAGTFPNYSKIANNLEKYGPDAYQKERRWNLPINGELLARAQKALGADFSNVIFGEQVEDPVLVVKDDGFALIMPMFNKQTFEDIKTVAPSLVDKRVALLEKHVADLEAHILKERKAA